MSAAAPEPSLSDERFARVQEVTDAALAHLELDDLLAKMLERVQDLLNADTAAVLLLDAASQQLTATAAKGIEAEVRQGVRIPLGKGFAGRIAAEKQPVILDKVDHTKVLNRILWEKGIRSLLGVPLLVGGTVTGVLHVGTLTPRQFDNDDVRLLQLAADRLALAIQSQTSQQERTAARTLQRSLVPAKLPDVPGLEFASRYVPGEQGGVGGDWYDVFTLPGNRVGIVIGDVAGHGFSAAAVMGRLRTALRAYALESDDPGNALTRLDRNAQHFETGIMATVLYAVLDPSLRHLNTSSAGHLAPIRCDPDTPAKFVDIPTDPPIGLPKERHSTVVDLEPGTLLCFYSDGLVERRDTPLDDRREQLRESVTATDPESVCAEVMAQLVGNQPPEDDLTVLVMRPQR